MARDPNIKLGVDTSDAVRNLGNLEESAVDAENKVEKLDGQTISIDADKTNKALAEVSDKLDKTSKSAKSAGREGIPVTTTAFKDLTEGIGGPASGAIGSAFKFGETIEGLGDLVEGFGGELGLSEEQIGNLTRGLGTALGVLGAVGVAFTVGKAAYDLFSSGAKKAAEEQKKFNDAVDASEKSLRGVAEALAAGERAKAFRDIIKDLEPDLQKIADTGLDAADAILEIAGAGKPFTDSAQKRIKALKDEIKYQKDQLQNSIDGYTQDGKTISQTWEIIHAKEDEVDALKDVTKAIEIRALGVAGATEIDKLATEALKRFEIASDDVTKQLNDQAEATYNAIGATRDFESTLDGVEQAVNDYRDVIAETPDDLEAVDDAARETAESVIGMAENFGKLKGAAVGTEDWKNRTTAAIGFVAGSLSPDDPLRKRLDDYIAQIAKVPTIVDTRFTNSTTPVPSAPGKGPSQNQQLFGGNTTVNVTVTSADPNAVVRAIQTYVRQNGRIPGIG